jgi:hypothetical protein
MAKEIKLTKLVGTSKQDFDACISNGSITLRRARLIPVAKPGDEVALTSVILSAIKLIEEFRKLTTSDLKMTQGGQIYAYTEVTFSECPESRIDGLILVVRGGKIKDAALWEMKNGTSVLEKEQVERYLQVAKFYGIPRLVTLSNQFVSAPTQSPLQVKAPKGVGLFHFSWSYLLTLSHILLAEKDYSIRDEDQVQLMKEVVSYLEHKKSGTSGFNQMKPGWSAVIEQINSGARLRTKDPIVAEVVESWHQEEQDVALILSRNLGLLVESGVKKHRNNLQGRLDGDTKQLIEKSTLSSEYRIRGAVSDLLIEAHFKRRTIEMNVSIIPPNTMGIKGQLGWLGRQLSQCHKKNPELYEMVESGLLIEVWVKNARVAERAQVSQIEGLLEHLQGREIRELRVIHFEDFGKAFSSRIKFVERLEQMALSFYTGVVQHLTNWEPTAPKIVNPSSKEDDGPESPEAVAKGEIPAASSQDHSVAATSVHHDEFNAVNKSLSADNCEITSTD